MHCDCVCGDAPRTGDAIVVCNCVGERRVGVMDDVTKVPPNVFVTVPGAKMRNPEGVVSGALTRTKLLVPRYAVETGAITGKLDVAGDATRGGVDNVLGDVVEGSVANEERGVLLTLRAPEAGCVPIAIIGDGRGVVGVALVSVVCDVVLAEFRMESDVAGAFEDVVTICVVGVFVGVAMVPVGAGSDTPGRVVMVALGGMSYF